MNFSLTLEPFVLQIRVLYSIEYATRKSVGDNNCAIEITFFGMSLGIVPTLSYYLHIAYDINISHIISHIKNIFKPSIVYIRFATKQSCFFKDMHILTADPALCIILNNSFVYLIEFREQIDHCQS